IRCVRPDLTTSLNRRALRSSERSSCLSAGSSRLVASSRAARCTALGNTSLDDWPKFTWSLGWALPPVSAEMTSLVFMFDEVPEPVWKTSIGNWLSCSPATIAAPASAISCASAESRLPSSALTRAAVPLIRPSQWITESGTVSPEIGKLSTAFLVSPPYSVFFFTGGMAPKPTTARAPRRSAQEGHQLARDPDGVVVGDQVAGPGQHAQDRVGQQVERLLGAAQRMVAILVGPQQQHGQVQPRQQVQHLAARRPRQLARQPRPRPREVR